MLACEEKTTASHRPVLGLQAFLITQNISTIALTNGSLHSADPRPTDATRKAAIDMIADVPLRLLGNPDVSDFYGEIHVQWVQGPKQIVLMFFPDRSPLLHHYLQIAHAANEHGIENASVDSLANRLRWLRA